MDIKELIAALAVLADPNASDEDKAAALDKLSAYFSAELEKQEGACEATETESASEACSDDEEGEEQTEQSAVLASALATIKELSDRMAKLEKASAVGSANRAKAPTVIERTQSGKGDKPVKDPVITMIETASANTLRNLSK